MKSEIASLHERISQGGDWREFQEEIAKLHAIAESEEEYVALLEAHKKLVAVAKFAFSDEKHSKILAVAIAEYKLFLNKEAIENGEINPVALERITRREIEAGRLDPNDNLRGLAVASSSILGDSANITAHRRKNGDWFFYGMGIAAVLSVGLIQVDFSPLWLVAVGFFAGWVLNERDRKYIKQSTAARRS